MDKNKRTPTLHDAVGRSASRVAILRALEGSPVDERDSKGRTALHLCAQKGKGAIARLLLRLGADVNARDSSGLSPLHLAAEADMAGMARLLLESGADPNQVDDGGRTPLQAAREKAGVKTMRVIATGAKLRCKVPDWLSELMARERAGAA